MTGTVERWSPPINPRTSEDVGDRFVRSTSLGRHADAPFPRFRSGAGAGTPRGGPGDRRASRHSTRARGQPVVELSRRDIVDYGTPSDPQLIDEVYVAALQHVDALVVSLRTGDPIEEEHLGRGRGIA